MFIGAVICVIQLFSTLIGIVWRDRTASAKRLVTLLLDRHLGNVAPTPLSPPPPPASSTHVDLMRLIFNKADTDLVLRILSIAAALEKLTS